MYCVSNLSHHSFILSSFVSVFLQLFSSNDLILDIKQHLNDLPEACHITVFHIEFNGVRLNDYFEISAYPFLEADKFNTVQVVEDYYDERSAKAHVRRVRELLVNPPAHITQNESAYIMEQDDAAPKSKKGKKADQQVDPDLVCVKDINLSEYNDMLKTNHGSRNQEGKVVECVRHVNYSAWNPPPGNRRLRGDLVYFEVTTLEDNTFHITGSVDGWFVNQSSASEFNPLPAPADYKSHSLVGLLKKASPKFTTRYQSLISRKVVCHPFSVLPKTSIEHDAWVATAEKHTYDWNRAEDSLLSTYGFDARGIPRDWNEEYQSCRLLPYANPSEQVVRDRTSFRVYNDFLQAAVSGAMAIAHGNIQPVNVAEPERAWVYIYNNIFFSFAVDNRDAYKEKGGDAAAYKAANHDLMGVRAYTDLDIPHLHTLAHTIVNYRGHRIVAQSIIAGIFHDETTEHLYGSMDNNKTFKRDDEFHKLMQAAAAKLHIKEHLVLDEEKNTVSIACSGEAKGLKGYDNRSYILDVSRAFPRDANYPDVSEHCTALLRPELVTAYARTIALKKVMEANEASSSENKEEEKTAEQFRAMSPEEQLKYVTSKTMEAQKRAQKEQDLYLETLENIRFNPDVFTATYLGDTAEQVKEDEQEVTLLSKFLVDEEIPKLAKDFANLNEIPADGAALTELFHSRGINMRYLGKVAELTTVPYVKNLLVQEMIVRTAKHLINAAMRDVKPEEGQREEHWFLAPCIAGFLNGMFGSKSFGANTTSEELAVARVVVEKYTRVLESRGTDVDINAISAAQLTRGAVDENAIAAVEKASKKNNNKKRKGKNNKKQAIRLADGSRAPDDMLAPSNIWEALRIGVSKRFSHELAEEVEISEREKLCMLRNLCGKVGLRISTRDYDLSGKTAEPFDLDDILDLFPVMKYSLPECHLASDHLEMGKAELAKSVTAVPSLSYQHSLRATVFLGDCIDLLNNVSGPLHPMAIEGFNGLAMAYYRSRQLSKAVNIQQRALVACERVYGLDDARTAAAHSVLARFLVEGGLHEQGLKHMRRHVYATELVSGRNHLDSINAHANLATILMEDRKVPQAIAHLEDAIQRCSAVMGQDHIQTGTLFHHLAIAYTLMGDYRKAVDSEKKCKEVYTAHFKEDHALVVQANGWLKKFVEAAVENAKTKQAPALLGQLLVRRTNDKGELLSGRNLPLTWLQFKNNYKSASYADHMLQMIENAQRAREDTVNAKVLESEHNALQERFLREMGQEVPVVNTTQPLIAPAPATTIAAAAEPVVAVAGGATENTPSANNSKNKKRRNRKKKNKNTDGM